MVYDVLIIGGGPAGLSAAIYAARALRSVLVVDQNKGRWNTFEVNENYFGFPQGIPTRKLRSLGLTQAKHFGATYVLDYVSSLSKDKDLFRVEAKKETYHSKTIILATGVTDIFPDFPNWKEYVGKSLFWCITCDGYKTQNKRVVILGQTDDAAITALQFLQFTKHITFVTNCIKNGCRISDRYIDSFRKHSIPFIEGQITSVLGKNGFFKEICVENEISIPVDIVINQQGCYPNTSSFTSLGVLEDQFGFVITDDQQKTNIPFVYAAGDLTKRFSHQIGSAVHEGATAAEAANYDLYLPEQKYPV